MKQKTLLLFIIGLYCIAGVSQVSHIAGNSVFCVGDSSHLSISTCGQFNGCTAFTAQWYLNNQPITGANNQLSYITNVPGLYTASVTVTGCGGNYTETTDTFRVYGEVSATLTLISDTNLCPGQNIKFLVNESGPGAHHGQTVSFFQPDYSYNYSDVDTMELSYGYILSFHSQFGLPFTFTAYGAAYTYNGYCTSTGRHECVSSRAYQVNLLNQKVGANVVGSNPMCSGDSLLLTLNNLNIPGQTYQWKRNNSSINGATSSNYAAKLNGAYYAVVNYQQGCSANSDTVNVTVNPSPQPTVTLVSGNLWQVSQSFIDYQWYRNDTLIPGANQSSFNIGSSNVTDYWYVVVTDANGCTAKSNLIALTSIANVGSDSYNMYPNPATTTLIVAGITPKTELILTNLLGETLYKTIAPNSTQTIDVSKLPAGVYFLNHLKFVKQ